MLTQIVSHCSVKYLGSLDVDSMPIVSPDCLEFWDGELGKGAVPQKTRFPLATDEKRRHPQVFDTFTYGDIGCGVAQGIGNATERVELGSRQQFGIDVRRQPSGMDRTHTDAFEGGATVSLDALCLLYATHIPG
jgi:hypothetical protein